MKEIMEKSKDRGMKTFDMALFDLCQAGLISEKEAQRDHRVFQKPDRFYKHSCRAYPFQNLLFQGREGMDAPQNGSNPSRRALR